MKNQKILILSGALLLATLVGCGPKTLKTEKAEEIISGFDTTLTGTVKATYHTDYQLVVTNCSEAMAASFSQDIDRSISVEADFTAGDLYSYVGYTEGTVKNEALVYEDAEKYYFLESTIGDPIALNSEAEAAAKIDELLKKISYTKAGWLTSDTFLYAGGNAYEHKQFLHDSTNIPLVDMDDTRKFVQNEDKGLTISNAFSYVGFQTDSGTSELKGEPGANIEIKTDAKGHVVSFTENYNDPTLEMALGTLKPLLTLKGSNTLTAEYGASLTKKTTIDHEATYGTLEFVDIKEDRKGKVEVYTCAPFATQNMTKVTPTTEIKAGDWICVKATPAGNNKLEAIMINNGAAKYPASAQTGNFHVWEAVPGVQKLSYNFSGNDALPTSELKVVANENVDVVIGTCAAMGFQAMETVTAGSGLKAGNWVCVLPTAKTGHEVIGVAVNGNIMPLIPAAGAKGYWCYTVVDGDNTVEVITKPTDATYANTLTVEHPAQANGTLVVKTCAPMDLGNMKTAVTGSELTTGHWICLKIAPKDGYTVTVTHNGSDKLLAPVEQAGGYYCFAVAAGANNVVVTYTAAA